MENPLIYLKTLSLLKTLSDGQLPEDEIENGLTEIKKSFWKVLPHQVSSPNQRSTSSTKLELEFLRSFEQLKK
jgi:hypothetical protein